MARNLLFWMILLVSMSFIFQNVFDLKSSQNTLSYTQFIQDIKSSRVRSVKVDNFVISAQYTDGATYQIVRPAITDISLIDELIANNVEVIGVEPEQPGFFKQLLIQTLPLLIFLFLFYLFMRQMQGGAGNKNNPFSFGKSKARMVQGENVKVNFDDVAGLDEARSDMQEIVDFLKEPNKFNQIGGRIPKGVLLSGPPGTGKTLMAKAIAGEAKVPFFSISGSDFVEMFVGVGASRVRDMFEQARKKAPCIVFIDEIDAVGRHRGAGLGGGHDEREQTLNQLLVEMDGFDARTGIIIIAATNRPDILDPALLRPGRFDRQIFIGLPDLQGREKILQVHMRKVQIDKSDFDPMVIARGTPGFSGADIENLVNEAALYAARSNSKLVKTEHFEYARDKIMMGPERRSFMMSEKDKQVTAYHEAGHAIIGYLVPEHDPVHKVTIIPRGRALGVTMFLPENDKVSMSKNGVLSNIKTLFGGRLAEELIFGKDAITTGAQNDIERATSFARNMTTKWGLSSLGPIHYDEEGGEVFLGMSAGKNSKSLGPDISDKIDTEVRKIIDQCYDAAKTILQENIEILHHMADELIKRETIEKHEIDLIMSGKSIDDNHPNKTDNSDSSSKDDKTKKNHISKKNIDKTTAPVV